MHPTASNALRRCLRTLIRTVDRAAADGSAFDNDQALAARPRKNAAVVADTAASHPAHFGNHAIGGDFVSTRTARRSSPYLLRSKPLPTSLKAPLDHFVYHIVNLDNDNQVLLSQYSIGGTPLMTTALHRSRTNHRTRFVDVQFEVTAVRDTPEPTPYGIPMPLPRSTRFVVHDDLC